MWLHIKKENLADCKSINMDHVTNVIFTKNEHYCLLFPMANICQLSVESNGYLNDYRIERWIGLFQTGNISQRDSVLGLTDDERNTNDRYLVVSYNGCMKGSSKTLEKALEIAVTFAKDAVEYYSSHEIASSWLYDDKTKKPYSHFVLDKQTGEKHFPKI